MRASARHLTRRKSLVADDVTGKSIATRSAGERAGDTIELVTTAPDADEQARFGRPTPIVLSKGEGT